MLGVGFFWEEKEMIKYEVLCFKVKRFFLDEILGYFSLFCFVCSFGVGGGGRFFLYRLESFYRWYLFI